MLIFPSAIVFLIVSIYPLLTGIMLSFQNSSLYKGDEKKFVGLKNIITILTSDAEFRSDLLFTVIYTVGIVVILKSAFLFVYEICFSKFLYIIYF